MNTLRGIFPRAISTFSKKSISAVKLVVMLGLFWFIIYFAPSLFRKEIQAKFKYL
jgi:hypothetical protein